MIGGFFKATEPGLWFAFLIIKRIVIIINFVKNLRMEKKNFIVPHDFSEVADIALNHAIAVAKTFGG